MRYLIDSNVWIEAAANAPHAVKALEHALQASWVGYSAITRLELFGYPNLNTEEERHLKKLVECFIEIAVREDVIDKAIAIRQAKRVRIPDALIAATALQTDSALITRNVNDFDGIDELRIVNPELI